ncbi:MAG: diversity-generating retroelement protein Avd [Deltaproteobacteria bacterium]|nr:diversity-generating retroelement protein Avd [Deltaproteobacteria bacterium]
MNEELKVISDFYDFTLWLVQRVEKFPRHHRYSLGTEIEKRLQTILALLLRAKYRVDKASFLDEANIELEILRFQLRMAKDLNIISVKSQGFAVKSLFNVGSQIGGWLKQEKVSR